MWTARTRGATLATRSGSHEGVPDRRSRWCGQATFRSPFNPRRDSESIPVDRADIEATRYRVAICALDYYADKPHDEPGYTIDEDVTSCLAPLLGRDADVLDQLRTIIRDTIADPRHTVTR